MAFKVEQIASATHGGVLTADRRIFLDATEQILVEADDPRARFQLAAPGHQIPTAATKRLGLGIVDGKVVQISDESAGEHTDEKAEQDATDETEKKEPPAEPEKVEKAERKDRKPKT